MKRCTKCGETKPLSEFYKSSDGKSGVRSDCKMCRKIYGEVNKDKIRVRWKAYYEANKDKRKLYNETYRKENKDYKKYYYQANKDKARNEHLKSKYGISLTDYENMFVAQNGVCGICEGDNNGNVLCVDHDKETGKVRGLLCSNCNTGIGLLKHKLNIILRAYQYLAPLVMEL